MMVCLRPCHACEMGEHDKHHEVISAAPPGMLGGTACPCEGECVDGRYCPPQFENLRRVITPARSTAQNQED